MSSSPQIVVDAGMYRVSASPKVGYMNGSDGATPLCHAGTFSGACSDCRCSLLNSLRTRQCLLLTKRVERRGGLFLYSASTSFFGGGGGGGGAD